jgi:hypothetical protein
VIRRLILRRFKRFNTVEFILPGHVVLAGPNDSGKTTALQAVAAWSLALARWKQLNDFHRHGGAYTRAPLARQAFSAVPLRAFDLLWHGRHYQGPVEIEIQTDAWTLGMELLADSTEQIHVRPKPVAPEIVRAASLNAVFVPAMSGLGTEEPVYQRPKIDQLLGQAKPGDVLRNLLVEANQSDAAWPRLRESIRRLFGVDLWPPDPTGAHIVAEYSPPGGTRYDIASAGSGFQQVLMLLTFLHARPGSVLLLDEPDAHLHVILQDAIYGELRRVAAGQHSQLIIATHSEVIIDAVEPRELYVMLATPRPVADNEERARLVDSLRILSHMDVMRALDAPGVLYLDNYTDLDILREWARVLRHPAEALLTTQLFWKPAVAETRPGASGILARDHYEALRLVRDDLPGLQLLDGDARPEIQATAITGHGFQRLRWRRYEIESYLLHPATLARFVERTVGVDAAPVHLADLRRHLEETYPPAVLRDPLGDHPYLNTTKARTDLLPPALTAAGLPGFPYTRYHEIAAVMLPEEIHAEIPEKLDGIMRAFRP